MKKIFRCLSITAKKKDQESDHSDDDEFEENPKQEQNAKSKSSESLKNEEGNEDEKNENEGDERKVVGEVNGVTDNGAEDPDPDRIQVVVEGDSGDDSGRRSANRRGKKSKESESKDESANPKKVSNKYVLAQIALAEESARLRRKEKREKKRMELSKYLGINAWKCDQKFLLNYGQEPEDIRERVIIIRKRNVKKERQRRIDEFIVRSEISAAARHRKKKGT